MKQEGREREGLYLGGSPEAINEFVQSVGWQVRTQYLQLPQ